ncbi:MAG: phasin family protein [Thalassospira sp.]|uniref:phasin family protein n=1 Tax=Thalassospira sp. TaxID=1912094 RepID=UPI0032EAB8B5
MAAKSDDVFGFGAMFMDPNAMEPYLQLWKTPEIDAMVSASQDALEESVAVANEAFTKLFETMTGQSDVVSGAGSRVVAQCEELLDTQQKSFEEVWHASMELFEKTGGIGTELATWMQREIEASQADIDALTKVESLSDIQELQTRILNRCYESSVAEGEKVQEIMMSVMADSFNAMTKAANTVTK